MDKVRIWYHRFGHGLTPFINYQFLLAGLYGGLLALAHQYILRVATWLHSEMVRSINQ